MTTITADLAAALSTIIRPGDFFASGSIEFPTPRLEIDGVGLIALPLLPVQAEQLVVIAERAPYGRGQDTLVDAQVRRTWQIGADRVHIAGKHWARTLDAILARTAEGLGISEPIEAELYKLLIYDQGSFFVSQRDTEKAPGMFAPLVLVLPSVSAGGELIIRHKGREMQLDLRCEDPSEAAFAAFYADCLHEVRPVTAGCRLTLVYNLLRRGTGPAPEPPSYEREQSRVAKLLLGWANGEPADDDAPKKLVYPLEHAYTRAELGFDTLKGADAAVASALLAAAPKGDCEVHLALVSIEETGMAEYSGSYSHRRHWDDDDDEDEFEAGEVDDRSVTLSEWRRPDRQPFSLGEIPVEDKEIAPPDAFEDTDPDEEHFHEATGNGGASFERTYSRAALVLWARERFFAVLNQAGLPVTLPYLEGLIERWMTSDEAPGSALWRQAHDLSGYMLSTWPAPGWHSPEDEAPSDTSRMLTLLTRLRHSARIDAFLQDIAAGGAIRTGDNSAIFGALATLSPDRATGLLERLIAGTATRALSACGDLLARAAATLRPDDPAGLFAAGIALIAAMPGDPARVPPDEPWQRNTRVKPRFVADLMIALARIEETLASRAADCVLARPETYGPDAVLVPALRDLVAASESSRSPAIQRLRSACQAHLQSRAAQPLDAPRDWRRDSSMSCRCAHCTELSRFLADPEQRSWVFKAAEVNRSHVEETIRRAGSDLDQTTDRRGRPYSLICTKNQASYDRRVEQRRQDLADLVRLNA